MFELRKIFTGTNHELKRREVIDAGEGWSKIVIVLRTSQNYILGAYCPNAFSNHEGSP